MDEKAVCVVCSGSVGSVFRNREFAYYACRNCGLVYHRLPLGGSHEELGEEPTTTSFTKKMPAL